MYLEKMVIKIAVLCVLFGSVLLTSAKTLHGYHKIVATSNRTCVTLGHFGCAVGTCPYQAKIRVPGLQEYRSALFNSNDVRNGVIVPQLSFLVFLDEQWDNPEFSQDDLCVPGRFKSRQLVQAPLNDEWTESISASVNQHIRPHVWYFAVCDCHDSIWSFLGESANMNGSSTKELARNFKPSHHVPNPSIEWLFEMKQIDGSEFPYELWRIRRFTFAALMCFCLIGLHILRRELRYMKVRYSGVHSLVYFLNAAVITQILSLIAELIHLNAYARNGLGWPVASAAADVFTFLSKGIISFILIFVGLGYGLNVDKVSDKHIFGVLLAATFTMSQFALFLYEKLDASSSIFRLHPLHGTPGLFFVNFQLLLVAVFGVSVGFTIQRGAKNHKAIQQYLFWRFLPPGVTYLATGPLLYAGLILACPPYLRHVTFIICSSAVQMAALSWMSIIFVLRKSDFFRVSTFSQSILPGGSLALGALVKAD